MSEQNDPAGVKSRNEAFAERTATKIWQEIPSPENPYITQQAFCHGYDLLELMQKRSYVDVLYLLLRGNLPTQEERGLLETLMVGLINPGPRHPAARAAMNAGVGKTDNAHILPIALTIYGGKHLGAGEIEPAMRFLRQQRKQPPQDIAEQLLKNTQPTEEGDWHIAPGFGSRFNGIDVLPCQIALQLLDLPACGNTLQWAHEFATALNQHGMGWLSSGLAAAVFTDLGFNPRAGAGLFQLIAAPGLLAHGVELTNKPITAMPFISDEHYLIEDEKK